MIVKRIRFDDSTGAWRAATWHDKEINTIWLCRALRISDFTSEEALYKHYGQMHVNGDLLPDPDELRAARDDAIRETVMAAFKEEIERARSDQDHWREVTVTHDNKTVSVGAVWFFGVSEDCEVDEDRFIVVLRKPPAGSSAMNLPAVAVQQLSDPRAKEKLGPASKVPAGRPLRQGEVPLYQRVQLPWPKD